MVPELISALLRANENEQNIFHARGLPLGLFRTHKAEMHWIYKYRERHRKFPTLKVFKSRFPDTLLPKNREGLDTAIQSILDQDLIEQISKSVTNAREIYESGEDAQTAASALRQAVNNLKTYDTRYTDLRGNSTATLKRYISRVKMSKNGGIAFLPSPWKAYNDLVGYSDVGELIYLASRTSIGKTWLSLWWAWHQCQQKERVLFVSKEMMTDQIVDRMQALACRLPYSAFRAACLPPAILQKWKMKLRDSVFNEQLANFIATGHETIEGVGFSHITSKIQEYRPTVLWVDGAYLIEPEKMNRASLTEKVIAISHMLKRIAKAEKLRVFASIQAKRDGEDKEGNTNVHLRDIFGGDTWAQDADGVIMVNGRRGSNLRKLSLEKGRESKVDEFNTRFQLDPRPDFEETIGVTSLTSSKGSVSFKTI